MRKGKAVDVKSMYDVVIVGGGPAGLTAALYLARARYRVVVVEKEKFGGQITITEEVVNYPGVAKTSGRALAETMRAQAEAFGAEFKLAEVTELVIDGAVKTVVTSGGSLQAFGVLLATGAHPRRIGFPGEEEFQGRGVAYCATCDGEFFTGKDVFVVGGGFAAAEESVFLTKYARHVTIMMRGDDFSCAKSAAEPALANPKITVLRNTEVEEVGGNAALEYLRYRNNKTGEVSECRAPVGDTFGVFVLAGYSPETSLLEGLAEVDELGYAVVDKSQRTTVEGLYAAGDVCAKSLRQVVTATGEGALAATELERYAAALQKKTGIVPERPQTSGGVAADAGGTAAGVAESAGTGIAARVGSTGTSAGAAVESAHSADASGAGAPAAGSPASTYLDPAMKPQLDAVFGRMTSSLVLELHLDDRPISAELRGWMEELAGYTDKLSVRVASGEEGSPVETAAIGAAAAQAAAPCVRVLRADGSDTGLAFHGVPGGHEFTSFILGLYNAAGPGQPIDDGTRARIADAASADAPLDITVLVSLSCTNCPDLVVAAQRIAADNAYVRTHVYDINHFPALKERYNVMSVPCLVVNEGEKILFGKKSLPQLLDALGKR